MPEVTIESRDGEAGPVLASSEAQAQLHLLKAEAAEGVAKVAGRVEADLVVMGTLSRAGVRGLLIGTTAETMLGRLAGSVLTVRPEEFQTPVSLEWEA